MEAPPFPRNPFVPPVRGPGRKGRNGKGEGGWWEQQESFARWSIDM